MGNELFLLEVCVVSKDSVLGSSRMMLMVFVGELWLFDVFGFFRVRLLSRADVFVS